MFPLRLSEHKLLYQQRLREQEALHRRVLYATAFSAIAHILLLGISIKQNSLVVVPQAKLPETIDLTLITTAETPEPIVPELPKSPTVLEPTSITEDANPSTSTEPVVAVNPVPTAPKSRSEQTPQVDTASVKTPITPPTEQTANVETSKNFQREANSLPQENPASENIAIPHSSVSNLPEPADQEVVNGTNGTNNLNNREQGAAVPSTNPSSITGFGDRIRNLLRGNSPTSNPSALQTNPTPSTAEPVKPQKVQCIRCDKPEYPAEARDRGLQGRARVAVDVDAEGNVINVRIIQSSGHAELDEAAVRQARQWKFTPSAAGRQGIGAKVDFQLEGSEYQRQRQRERQAEELARQEKPQPAKPAPEVARQEMPQPVSPAEAKPAPVPEVARQEITAKPDLAVPPPEPIIPKPPAVSAPQPVEND